MKIKGNNLPKVFGVSCGSSIVALLKHPEGCAELFKAEDSDRY